MKKKHLILGYSGGLDTTFSLKYLQEKYDFSITCVTINIGQKDNFEEIKEIAHRIGCENIIVIDGLQEFIKFFIRPSIQANALYQDIYPLATALSRPYIGYKLVEIAKKINTKYLCHACTGKGNDQIRIEMAVKALLPDAEIVDPVRDEGFSRDTEIEYLRDKKIITGDYKEKIYSIDQNIWGRSICAGILEDPWIEPPSEVFEWTKNIDETSNKPTYVEIEFKNGIPIRMDNKDTDILEIINYLNKTGGENGVGRIDHIEDRVIGLKSREVYEAPAAIILITAHKALENLVLTKDAINFKRMISEEYAKIIYNGFWFSSHNFDIISYLYSNQKRVNGTIRVKLYKGNCYIVGRQSENTLYDRSLITYTSDSTFNQISAKHFIELFSLQNKIETKKQLKDFHEISKIEEK